MLLLSSCVFLFLLFFQNIDLVTFPGSESSIKFYHIFGIFTLLFYPVSTAGQRFPFLPTVFFVAATVVAAIGIQRFGFNGRVVTLFYSLIFFFYFFAAAQRLSYETVLRFLKTTTLLLYVAIFFKVLIYWDIISQGYGAQVFSAYFFFPGGPNIEVTWMALFLMFFLREKWWLFWFLALYVMGFALIYESRVGQLATVIMAGFYIAQRCHPRLMYGAALLLFGALVTAIIMIDYDALLAVIQENAVGRFAEVGDENDGFGKRVMMWGLAAPLIQQEWLLGYGVGNIMKLLQSGAEHNIIENNLHNIYVQFIADLGIGVLLLFMALIFQVLHRYFSSRDKAPELALLLVGYALTGFVQFTGFEVLFWAIAGLYYGFYIQMKQVDTNG